MNFLLDAMLGMLVIWLAVKLMSKLIEYKQWTLLTFGEYGELRKKKITKKKKKKKKKLSSFF